MDHLQSIRIFTRVVETGSFTLAAQSLEMPNATVSKWVKSLERRLGVTLLERTTRHVTVTNDGAAYYARMRQLLGEFDDVEATFQSARASPRGELRVETGGAIASHLLIPALPAFQALYPDIRVRLSVTDRTVDVIAENIDCALRGRADDPELISQELGSFAITTCASPAWLKLHGTPRHPRDIVEGRMPVAGYFFAGDGVAQPLRFRRGSERIVLEGLESAVLVSDSHAHLASGLAGLGVMQTLDFVVRPAIEAGTLVAVLERWRADPAKVYAAYSPSRRYSTKVKVFIDWASSIMRQAMPAA
ncbi:LysR family transcriptional regulator [soil metagenome]